MLRSLKLDPKPASLVSSPFLAGLNPETCKVCGTCITRCPMEAIRLDNKKAVLNVDRCIGCGLCVSTCPTQSLSLNRKPEAQQPYVPKNTIETNTRLARVRGKSGTGRRIGMQVRSKLDRLLAR